MVSSWNTLCLTNFAPFSTQANEWEPGKFFGEGAKRGQSDTNKGR